MGSRRWVMQSISITGCWRTPSSVPVRSGKGPSVANWRVMRPSSTSSASAGTFRSCVLHLTSGVGASAWAMDNSSTSIGGDMLAARSTCSGQPMAMATGKPSGALPIAVWVPRRSTTRAAKRRSSSRSKR